MDQPDLMIPDAEAVPVSFRGRWDLLRNDILRYWLDDRVKLKDLVGIMKERHDFDASESQYKYRFKEWGIKRSLSKEKKGKLLQLSQMRAKDDKATSITHYGRPIDARNIRRHAKQIIRGTANLRFHRPEVEGGLQFASWLSLPLGNRIFLGWNLPYVALLAVLSGATTSEFQHHPSPFTAVATPISDISVNTPPAGAPSPRDVPSPLSHKSTSLTKTTRVRNARLFVGGKHLELIRSLDAQEQKNMATWLYQFWLFSFKTAKHWGHGPRRWTADSLGFSQFAASSPGFIAASPSSMPDVLPPTQLCKWAIHVLQDEYEPIIEKDEAGNVRTNDDWPASWTNSSFEDVLRDNLETNDFSSLSINNIPVAIPQIAAAASQSPLEMLLESVGFAIIGRNLTLLENLLTKVRRDKVDISSLFPLHLAVTYLDGSTTCCTILHMLINSSCHSTQHAQNDLGHTIVDSLFLSILRSHTSVPSTMIDVNFQLHGRLPGEEVDICGRWEADSTCYKQLLLSGQTKVPLVWKHKFCHTSAQAVSHCISEILWQAPHGIDKRGIFHRLCGGCGLRMHLTPLHTLVVVSYCLATFGMDGEDLFGVVCCLIPILQYPTDPRILLELSVNELLGIETGMACSHISLSPSMLADLLSQVVQKPMPQPARVGWKVFCLILKESELAWNQATTHHGHEQNLVAPSDDGYKRCDYLCEETIQIFSHSPTLGHVFAAVQTEMLTYRRQQEGDSWTSPNFDMQSVLKYLMGEKELHMPLISENMVQDHCRCGNFENAYFPRKTDVERFHFSNLEDWDRTCIIDDRRWRDDV